MWLPVYPVDTGYYYPAWVASAGTSNNGGATAGVGAGWALPYRFGAGVSIGITAIGFQHTDAVDGGGLKIRVAIYTADADWLPDTLVVDAGELTKDTTATNVWRNAGGTTFSEVTLGPSQNYLTIVKVEAAKVGASLCFSSIAGAEVGAMAPWGVTTSGIVVPGTNDSRNQRGWTTGTLATGAFPSAGSSLVTTYAETAGPGRCPAPFWYISSVG